MSFVFIPMGQSPRQKIAPNVSRIKATIPMINNELKPLQSRRKRLIENHSNIADDIAEIDKELAIHRRVSRLNYSRRCAEASAVQVHMKQGIPLAPGMEIGYVIRDARKWEVDPERTASKFDAAYYRGLLGKAWGEVAFVFR